MESWPRYSNGGMVGCDQHLHSHGPSRGQASSCYREWDRLEVMDRVLVHWAPTAEGLGRSMTIVVLAAENKVLWAQYHEVLGHARDHWLLRALQERLF